MTIKYRVDGNFHIYLRFLQDNSIEEVPVKSCSISEEDLRIKSAKISTYKEIDLSNEMTWLYITYMDATVYSGIILDGNYDEKNGIYSYQSLGHQRWLTSKTWYVHNPKEGDEEDLYKAIENMIDKIKEDTSIDDVVFHPKEDYMVYSPPEEPKEGEEDKEPEDTWDLKDGLFYDDKTYYEILMSMVGKSNYAIDCYVDEFNVLHLDPIDTDSWRNDDTIQLIPSDLAQYDYKSNATNIITGVYIKTYDIYKDHMVTEPNFYSSEDMLDIDLTLYYGKMEAFEKVEANKELVNTESETQNADGTVTTEVSQKREKVIDAEKNEKKARNKITSSIRDLMSFTIETNKYIPQLHTNMFMWFETPKKHVLANYSKFVAKIDQTTTRGGEYVLNRFYVEKIDTTYSESKITSKITINPFASDMSEYAKAYDDAKNAYEQANCSSSGSQTLNSGNGTGSDGTQTKSPPPNAGTITVTMYPTSGAGMPPYTYKKYTKTWRNWCPICGRSNTLADTPKGTPDGDITCWLKLGGCDSDYDGVVGKCKAGECPNPGCIYNWVFLVDANGRSNSRGNYDVTVGGNSDGVSGASNSVGGSTQCLSGTGGTLGGSYQVSQAVANLANQVIPVAQNESQVCRDSLKLRYNFIQYHGYSNFEREPDTVISMGGGNCCDGTRLQLNMCAYKGVSVNKLFYIHIYGHVYGNYDGTDIDWVKGTDGWANHWGSGSFQRKTQFPTLPFGDYKYGFLTDWFSNFGKKPLSRKEDDFIEENSDLLFSILVNDKLNIKEINYPSFKDLFDMGYMNYSQYIKELPSYYIVEFEDMEKKYAKL